MGTYPRVSAWRAVWPVLSHRQRFLEMAWRDNVALNWREPDMRRHMEAGIWPTPEAEPEFQITMDPERQAFLRNFVQSGALTLLALFVAVVLAVSMGSVDLGHPPAWAKILTGTGGALMAWPTIMILGRPTETIAGDTLIERMPPVFFRLLFVPGFILATLGAVL